MLRIYWSAKLRGKKRHGSICIPKYTHNGEWNERTYINDNDDLLYVSFLKIYCMSVFLNTEDDPIKAKMFIIIIIVILTNKCIILINLILKSFYILLILSNWVARLIWINSDVTNKILFFRLAKI